MTKKQQVKALIGDLVRKGDRLVDLRAEVAQHERDYNDTLAALRTLTAGQNRDHSPRGKAGFQEFVRESARHQGVVTETNGMKGLGDY